MDPITKLRELAAFFAAADTPCPAHLCRGAGETMASLIDLADKQLADAILTERERCAKVIERDPACVKAQQAAAVRRGT